MDRLSEETRRLVKDAVERVLALQEDLRSEPDDVLRSFMGEEIERCASKVKAEERAGFLEELHGQFPAMSDPSVSAKPAVPRRRRERVPEEEAQTPQGESERVEELDSQAEPEGATNEQPAEPVPVSRSSSVSSGRVAMDPKLAKALGLSGELEIDAERAVEMLGVMAEMIKGMDQVMWSTWKVLSPRSPIKGAGEVMRAVGAYASDEAASLEDVQRSTDRLRQLSAALVSAISQTGRQFAQRHADRFGPEHIEAWSAKEKKATESASAVCWRKYKEMYGTSDQATIEREIMQQIADYGERLMSGLERVETKG